MDRNAIANALRIWRCAADLLAEPMFDDDRDLYENAVAAVVPELAEQSVAHLVARYGADGEADITLARAACVGAGALSDCEMLPDVVLDAAFWRRCRQLVAGAVARA